MAFDINKLFDDESFVSPGSIGGKIKKYRELRGWSQKELGIRCGFSASTADVRIAQYEKNRKIPREKVLKDIAAALQIDECALFDADLLVYNRMYHALFEIEDFHGLHPVKKPDGYYLEFSGPTLLNTKGVLRFDYYQFLAEWYGMRQKCQPASTDTPEESAAKSKEYTLWRGEYPQNIAREQAEKMSDRMKMHRLQAEMDVLNAKMKNDEELERIDKALEPIMPEIRAAYTPISRESELIMIIKSMIDKGIDVEQFSPEEIIEMGTGPMHLLSIRTEDIINNDEVRSAFAYLVCAIETIQAFGIEISRRITSRNNELFITYEYPDTEIMCFDKLHEHWKDMLYIYERKGNWTEKELAPLEEQFRTDITGENDVLFQKHDD